MEAPDESSAGGGGSLAAEPESEAAAAGNEMLTPEAQSVEHAIRLGIGGTSPPAEGAPGGRRAGR